MALTAEQRKKIDEAIAALRAEAMRTDPIDRDACVAALREAYAVRGLAEPKFVFCSSPWDALQRVESMVPDGRKFRETLGEEVSLCLLDHTQEDIRAVLGQPIWEDVDKRVRKVLEVFPDLANAVGDVQEKRSSRKDSMLYNGNNMLWDCAITAGQIAAFAALGMVKPPRDFAAGVNGLHSCNQVFAYERCCFIGERPQSFTHPQVSKDAPRDRITFQWADGFSGECELWF